MPSYSIAFSDDGTYGELVGSNFFEWKVSLLRENCDYDGVICTDWGLFEEEDAMAPWGMEDQSTTTRIRKAYEAGVDQIAGAFYPMSLLNIFKEIAADEGDDAALERAQASARRILKTLFEIRLMDNPYVDTSAAEGIAQSDELLSFASDCMDKSLVLLKNKGGVICKRSEKPTVYVPMSFSASATPAGWSLPVDEEALSEHFNLVTDTIGDPTGPAGEDGAATYTESDIARRH